MKSPYNWVGNKYKYTDVINNIVKGNKYNDVIDCFMGSGNILFNIDCEANRFIGNDKIKLLPKLYNEIKNVNEYSLEKLEFILYKWNNFSSKEDYYNLREYWNIKYKDDLFDEAFIYETAILLKMCSNSMVRFNSKNEFNQGFRGLGNKKEFFTENMKNLIVDNLILLNKELINKNISFMNDDFINIEFDENDLLILDPPYILRSDMYGMDFTKKHDDCLINILDENKCDFIYFNYLERDGIVYKKLKNIIDKHNYNVIELSDKTMAGQGRSRNTINIKEVLITNMEVK